MFNLQCSEHPKDRKKINSTVNYVSKWAITFPFLTQGQPPELNPVVTAVSDRCPVSGVRCPVSGVRCPVSGVRCQMSGVHCPLSTARCPVSSVRCPLSGVVQCPVSLVGRCPVAPVVGRRRRRWWSPRQLWSADPRDAPPSADPLSARVCVCRR